MDAIIALFKFLWSYPVWMKAIVFANLLCIVALFVFVRPASVGAQGKEPKGSAVLRIKRVELFPRSETAEVQVSAFVNDTEFKYPSIAGVEWLKVGPAMAGEKFDLPNAEKYELRFEMRRRGDTPGGKIFRYVSQVTVSLGQYNSEGTYALFFVEGTSRGADVSAQVDYSFEPAQ